MNICECGSKHGLSKHVSMPSGWLSLTRPLCLECRGKRQSEFQKAFSDLEKRIEEREAKKSIEVSKSE